MNPNPPRVAVVILNWNGKTFLEKFLPGIMKSCENIAELIIADNASTDSSLKFLHEHYPQIRTIALNRNSGFTGGYNEALKKIKSEYYVLLNSDVEVKDDWINPVIRLMDSNKKIAACQPKILSQRNPEEFEYAGAAGGFLDKYGFPFCRGRIFQQIEKDTGQYNDNRKIFWATGACMFVRASCFHELNGFDENFFAHMEEIDLCWRLQDKGYEIWYCADSKVYHVGGGTLSKHNPRKTYLNYRNNLFMLYKNLPDQQYKKVISFRRWVDGLAAVKFLFSNGYKDSIAVIRAHRDFQRKKNCYENTRTEAHLSDFQYNKLVYSLSILSSYYFRGVKKFSELKGLGNEE